MPYRNGGISTIAEDQRGNKFYNLNEDLASWREKYKTPQGAQDRQLGAEGFDEGETGSTFNQSIVPDQDGFNLHVLNQSVGTQAKGSITFAEIWLEPVRCIKAASSMVCSH